MPKRLWWACLLLAGPLLAETPAVNPSTAPVAVPSAAPAAPPAPTAAEAPPAGVNQIVGTVLSMDPEGQVLRLTVEGGYSVQFTFDANTVFSEGKQVLSPNNLEYGDRVAVRYAGKELQAKQVLRLEKARRTVPDLPPETSEPVVPVNPG